MKKMVIMAAALVGLAVNAASINWSFSWATDANGDNIAAGSAAYLVSVADYSQADAAAALDAGTFDTSKVVDTASIKVDDDSGAHVAQVASSALTGSQSFYAIIKTDSFYAMTDPTTVTMKSLGDTVVSFFELSDENGNSFITWKPAGGGGGDVPEPTSGLLLLVGGAMLVLRRKQK